MSKQSSLKEENASASGETFEVNINFLIKFISKFDGTRELLNPFLNNCRNAIELANPVQKPILFKFILSQLEGKAQTACALKEFDDFEQLESFLKNLYGERKHYTYLLTELQECRQEQKETVNQFALRIETCLSKLLSEINLTVPTSKRKTEKKGELAGRAAAMEDLALHTFVTGLHPSVSTILRCREPESLSDAISYACEEEKIFLSSRKHSMPFQNRDNAKYNRDRYTIQNQSRPQPSRFQGGGPVNKSALICRYCKNIGHSIENCRKRQFNNNRNRNFNEYQAGPSNNNNTDRPRDVKYMQEVYSCINRDDNQPGEQFDNNLNY